MSDRILTAVSLTWLMLTAAAPEMPKTAAPLPSAFDAGWKGARVCEPLFENDRMRSARCTFPPGGGHDRHFHPPHWGYIVEGGTMRITDASGTRVRTLKAGTSWWSDGIQWHEAVNVGSTTAVYIIVEPK
jgi:beta-alanine degradation protein BauB